MLSLEIVTGTLAGVSVALSVLSIWMVQVVQRRLDRFAEEVITDVLKVQNDIAAARKAATREVEVLRRETVGRAHYLEAKARDSLH